MALVKAINPGKRSLSRGINYISNPEKTEENLISGKDCDAQTVLEEMKATKELYSKTDGRQYKHFIQSFKPDDPLDPEQAHRIGYEMAQKAFPGFEVLVATHTDKDHLHNHFIVNSVSFETGVKYRQSISDLQEIKDLSNRICEREGLHVMSKEEQTPGKSLSMNQYQVAKRSESWKFKTMGEIDKSLKHSKSKEEFIKSMESKGYQVKWTDERKYITYTTPDGYKVRDNKLHDPKYLKEEMTYGFVERAKENQLQFGRSPNDQQDIGADIHFPKRDERQNQVHSERASEPIRTDSEEIGAGREDHTGVRNKTLRERESQGGVEGKTRKNINSNASRDKRTQSNEFQKNGDDRQRGQRGNTKEPGDLRKIYQGDHGTSVSSKGNSKSKLAGKIETVRSKPLNVSWNNSSSPGPLPGIDRTDEIIKSLGDSIDKVEALAERKDMRQEQKTRTSKHHEQENENER